MNPTSPQPNGSRKARGAVRLTEAEKHALAQLALYNLRHRLPLDSESDLLRERTVEQIVEEWEHLNSLPKAS